MACKCNAVEILECPLWIKYYGVGRYIKMMRILIRLIGNFAFCMSFIDQFFFFQLCHNTQVRIKCHNREKASGASQEHHFIKLFHSHSHTYHETSQILAQKSQITKDKDLFFISESQKCKNSVRNKKNRCTGLKTSKGLRAIFQRRWHNFPQPHQCQLLFDT